MLYFLLYEKLYPYISPFRVFRYNTFRTAFASLTALFLCIALGPWLIHKLRQFQIGQYIREEGPKSHQKKAGTPTMGGVLIQPLLSDPWTFLLGILPFFIFVAFVIVGASNAVNLTDGLDGLAIGLMVIASGALTVLSYAGGHVVLAEYLQIARNPRTSELTIFCGAMTGASLGFLWYNAHPAEIFMGDVGALGLGGAMAMVAILIKQEVLLVFIGGVFVLEALSVILQVGSFKLRGKRIFKMAPLHHHFEALGWTESKIIARFWISGLVLALFALTTLKLR